MSLVVGAVSGWQTNAYAEEPNSLDPAAANQNTQAFPTTQNSVLQTENGDRALIIKTLASKKVVGANVDNLKGEKLGTIDDLVIDLQTGKVAYAALSVGGVLGIGDKLFAVPFEELKSTYDSSNAISFVLDASKEKLEHSPGFDKNHWPDFASPQWKSQIDTYYHPTSANRSSGEQPAPANR
jgi:sporulation protein YlmC with PRC-barrel domain